MNYRTLMRGSMVLAAACWAVPTGLSIEKVVTDGVQSWTLLLAMPVFVAAVAILLHLAVEDFRHGRFIRPVIAIGLSCLTLWVTLPNSIGSAGSAKDTVVAQAEASNRNLAFSEKMLSKAEKDLDQANAGVLKECEGAPKVIIGDAWPKCQWWRRQVDAHTLAVNTYGKGVVDAPVEKQPLSGEKRIAWALSWVGARVPEEFTFSVTEADVQMVQPMTAPVAGELLCAFFGFMALEFLKLARREEEEAAKAKAASPQDVAPAVTVAEPAPAVQVAAIDPEPVVIETSTDPVPPKGGRKPNRRERRKSKVFDFGKAYKARHGHWPTHGQIAGRFHLPGATASRYRQEMMAEAA